MLTVTLAKFFHFSASFSKKGKVYGHNYVLGVTVNGVDNGTETMLINKIESGLIDKINSRDLELHVDFLKGVELTDENILRVFWKIIAALIAPVSLKKLSLERDSRTVLTLTEN